MHREGEAFPRTTTQAPSPSEKRRARGSPPFSPLLTQSQGSVHRGEEARTRRPPWALPSSPGALSGPAPTHSPVWLGPTDGHVETPGGVPCECDHLSGHSHYLWGAIWGAWNHI